MQDKHKVNVSSPKFDMQLRQESIKKCISVILLKPQLSLIILSEQI